MARIVFIEANGTSWSVEAAEGLSLMQLAVNAGIDAIAAECGGACACGTCHCYIDSGWTDRLPQPDEQEAAMLECVINQTPESRLSCQIELSKTMDGLVVRLPGAQR